MIILFVLAMVCFFYAMLTLFGYMLADEEYGKIRVITARISFVVAMIGFTITFRYAGKQEAIKMNQMVTTATSFSNNDGLDIMATPIPAGKTGGWRGFEVSITSKNHDGSADYTFTTESDDTIRSTDGVIVTARKVSNGNTEVVKTNEKIYTVYAN